MINPDEKLFNGIPAASGLAIGKAFCLESEILQIPRFSVDDPEKELARLGTARQQAADEAGASNYP